MSKLLYKRGDVVTVDYEGDEVEGVIVQVDPDDLALPYLIYEMDEDETNWYAEDHILGVVKEAGK